MKVIIFILIATSFSSFSKEAIYRKIGDLMYIPKKGEFINEAGVNFSNYESERVYTNLPNGLNSSGSEFINDIQTFNFYNKLSYGLNHNLSMNLKLGYTSNNLSNSAITSLYFNDLPFNQEVQYEEDNSGMINPQIGFLYRLSRQARSRFTLDLYSNIHVNTGDAERSEGHFKGGSGIGTTTTISEYANNLNNSNSGVLKDGNGLLGGHKLEIGARMGKKYSPRVDVMAFLTIGYELEKEITHLNGDLTQGSFSNKEETIDATIDATIGGLFQYRLKPSFILYSGGRLNFTPSYNSSTRYLAGLIKELEEFDSQLNFGFLFGGKWVVIDRKLLIDLSVDIQSTGKKESKLFATSPTNSNNSNHVQYEYESNIIIAPQLKFLFLF